MRTATAGLIATAALAFAAPAVTQAAEGARGLGQGRIAGAADRIPVEQFAPLPAAGEVEVSAATRKVRRELLGSRANDPRYVTLNWTGVASFVVTMKGHLFLFDAWEIVGVNRDYSPADREDLAALEPEAIFHGHAHFDHAADTGYVAGRTGAAVITSDEGCDVAKEDAAREGNRDKFTCVIAGNQTTPAFGVTTKLRLFEDLRKVTILKSLHSSPQAPGPDNPLDPFLPVGDPTPYLTNPNTSPQEIATFLDTLRDPEGGTRMYHFRVGDFALLLGDSAGPINQQPTIRSSLDRGMPGCVDVLANAILGFDQPVSGLRDPVRFVENSHPKVFLPTHADRWFPGISAGQDAYREELATELGRLRNPPQVDFLLDPGDYLKPRAYRVASRRWKAPMPGSSCARAAQRRRGDPRFTG